MAQANRGDAVGAIAGDTPNQDRIGLELGQLLAFSLALDSEFEGLDWPLDTLSEDDMRRGNEVADVFQELWANYGNSIEGFGKAA